jgi:C-terminal processing protease CtpA/Prc
MAAVLSACGGGASPPPVTVTPPVVVVPPPVTPPVTPPVIEPPPVTPPVTEPPPVTPPVVTPPPVPPLPDWYTLLNHCEHPAAGQTQGTLNDELRWLYSYVDEMYLWYRELPKLNMADYKTPVDYFAMLKTPAITASGRAKDRFHFTYPTDVWEAMSSAGVELGYGITWSHTASGVLPRVWVVAMVEPGSPGAAAGLQRGDTLLSVNGIDMQDTSSQGVAAINTGLSPAKAGDSYPFVLSRGAAAISLPVTLTAAKVAAAPVQNYKLLASASGTVGYLQFHDHNAVAESQLADAFTRFKSAGVSDLVLDMRYNGGGYLVLAAELAYMIAGPDATKDKIFEQLHRNDKQVVAAPQKFAATAAGLSPRLMKYGTALPYLGLKRVTILTTPGTCSASESVINGLRGADIEVTLIGGETCGKPYAFTPAPNCGTTYFAIEVQGTNNKGFGDYADGFAPTCKVDDDLAHEMGDTSEGMLAAALNYRATGVCPATPLRNRSLKSSPLQVERPQGKQIAIRLR